MMEQFLNSLRSLPLPAKAGAALGTLAVLVGAASLFSGMSMVVVLVGIAIVALMLLGYRQVLKIMAKRKSEPMARALAGSGAMAPQAISDPARRARLDDLRKNFENGIEKFRAAGKNLYSLPWYLLVGEPGSGKTEAIRHCNVGFPPGLQDQLQGAGGTINMNWWFTNHAVILDTAGRLMFEEVEPGTTNEWQEFLKLLKKTRPNCPINGMLLVIPAESLIRDTADAIERKGGKIAQQLDQIQRALGVRFPVFVVITKCDLINGFREFFDDLKDPQLQHQILGWTNPSPLDEPFNPELVDKHLETVAKRIMRRRYGLMYDPVHTEDPTARRTDQVDALFAFPESLQKLAPRLRRYLEMIFVAGAWSAKPLFLRGIYFTSSMREGSALDADLAEALGLPVESLPEGRVWERDRAYFLRDLFIHKVFREKGLVTRATNTKAQQRQRQMLVMGTAAVGAVALTGFTYLGYSGLKSAVVAPKDFWVQTRDVYMADAGENFVDGSEDYFRSIIFRELPQDEDFKYRGSLKAFEKLDVDEDATRIARFPEEVRAAAERPVPVPWVFRPVAAVTGDIAGDLLRSERRDAARVLIEASVVRPLVDAALTRVRADAKAHRWSEQASAAFQQLLRLHVARVLEEQPEEAVRIAPLLAYATMGNDSLPQNASKDVSALQGVIDWLYSKEGGAKLPPAAVWPLGDAVAQGAAQFNAAWAAGGPTPGSLAAVNRLVEALGALADAETELLRIDTEFSAADYGRAVDAWRTRYAKVREAAARVEQDYAVLADRSLVRAHEEELRRFRDRAKEAYEVVLAELDAVKPVEGQKDPPGGAKAQALRDLRQTLQSGLDKLMADDAKGAELKAQLAKLDAMMLDKSASGTPGFRARVEAYAAVDAELWKDDVGQGVELGQYRPRLESVSRDLTEAEGVCKARLVRLPQGAPGAAETNERIADAEQLCRYVLTLAGKQRRTALVERFLGAVPGSGEALAERAGQVARERQLSQLRPSIPLTVGATKAEFDPRFHPTIAAAILSDAKLVGQALGPDDATAGVFRAAELRPRFAPVRQAAEEYQDRFLRYWTEEQLHDLRVVETTWTDMSSQLAQITQGFVFNRGLRDIAAAMQQAASETAEAIPAEKSVVLRQMADTAAKTLGNEAIFAQTCDRVLNSWRTLGAYQRVIDARKVVLDAVRKGEFQRDYAIFEGPPSMGGSGDLVLRFWEDLSYKALLALAVAAEQDARASLDELKRTARFPLRRLKDDRTQMTVAEVLAAQGSVEKVRAGEATGGAGAGGTVARPTGSEKFNAAMDRLMGLALLNDTDRAWIARVDRVLSALPRTEKDVLQCRVHILTDRAPEKGMRALEELFPNMDIVQGQAPCSPRLRSRPGPGQAPVPVAYAGEAVRMCFYSAAAAADRPDATLTFDGPWGALQLLHQYDAKPVTPGDTKTWAAEVVVPYNAGGQEIKLSLWLKLEFDRPLPTMEEWPD
jgi:hypothetical protein